MRKASTKKSESRELRPVMDQETRETQLIALAMDVAEERLRNGTASSQEVTHFLKLGSTRNQLEKEKIRHENLLLEAKTDLVKSSKASEELYAKALAAMRGYQGTDAGGDVDV